MSVAASATAAYKTPGKTRYDAMLLETRERVPDVAGYVVLMRSTTALFRENDIFVGSVLRTFRLMKWYSVVKAIDKDGNESLVSFLCSGAEVQTKHPDL